MEFVYPAVFHGNNNGSYTVCYPDLPGCITEGKSLANAIFMAEQALAQWVDYLEDKKQELPASSPIGAISIGEGEFVNLIRADVKNSSAVRRAVSIPKWMDDGVTREGLSLSRILQDALKKRLSV